MHTHARTHLLTHSLAYVRYKPTAKAFGVDINATSAQIPTVILLKNGEEVMRLPSVGPDAVVQVALPAFRVTFTATAVHHAFPATFTSIY